ncbi:hypothetical protein FC959_12550 [Clostridium botulinum]|nr:hypothetical protein [Clostridium botulinum]
MEINDSNITFNSLIQNDSFNADTKIRAKEADVLILPDFGVREGIDRAFQSDTISFYKYSRTYSNHYKIDLYENKSEEKILSLHSFDIWIPTIFIASSILLPFVINLTSSYVYDKLKGRESDEATVHFHLIVEDKDKKKTKSLYYKGPHSAFKDKFDKIDINRLWED